MHWGGVCSWMVRVCWYVWMVCVESVRAWCAALIHPHESDGVGRIYQVIRCAVCAVRRWDVFVQCRQGPVCAPSAKSSMTTVPYIATIWNAIRCVPQGVCVEGIYFLMNACAGASSCRTCILGSFPASGQHILPTLPPLDFLKHLCKFLIVQARSCSCRALVKLEDMRSLLVSLH